MLLAKAKQTIEKYKMLQKGDRVLVCVSGGPDSVALLILLNSLKKEYGLKLRVAHLNHMLRGKGSDLDEKFVRRLAQEYSLPFIAAKADVKSIAKTKKKSLEEAARDARYGFFFDAACGEKLNKIAIAHNRDDQAETMLMRLLRSSGLQGLGGILPVRSLGSKYIIRPLLEISRCEIERYLRSKNIRPRRDPSNLKPVFFRNRVRLELLPLLERRYNNGIKEILFNTADNLRTDYEFILAASRRAFKKITKARRAQLFLDLEKFRKQHPALRKMVLRMCIKSIKKDLLGIDLRHLKELDDLIYKRKDGSVVDLPRGVSAKKSAGNIIFYAKNKARPAREKALPRQAVLGLPGAACFGCYTIKTSIVKDKQVDFCSKGKNTEYFDLDKLKLPLYIRARRPGDRIGPFGMAGRKKLQDVFIDEKVPAASRRGLPLIFSKHMGIIWACGVRRAAVAPVVKGSKNLVKIEIKKSL